MTVAACVLPTEPPAIIMQNSTNPAGGNLGTGNPVNGNPVDGNRMAGDRMGGETGDQSGGNTGQSPPMDQPSATTVQLPSFDFTYVNTTVSVPDGGTVLLGGIKGLSEHRVERGVPLLNKIPYLNRLFRNEMAGRESSSLMLMVTPRIIIQEEE